MFYKYAPSEKKKKYAWNKHGILKNLLFKVKLWNFRTKFYGKKYIIEPSSMHLGPLSSSKCPSDWGIPVERMKEEGRGVGKRERERIWERKENNVI